MSIKAVDVSNHQGELTVAQVQGWGVEHVVVRLSHERPDMIDLARRQLQVCRDAGCSVSGYTWAYLTDNPDGLAQYQLGLYQAEHLPIVWVDCEDTKYVGSPDQNVDWLSRYIMTLEDADQSVGIYTGRWWWVPYMRNTTLFANYPLWAAQYDGVPDLAVWTPFGGWDALWGKQYNGSPLDLDVFDERVLGEGEAMDDTNYTDLVNLLGVIQGDWSQAAIDAIQQAKVQPRKAERNASLDAALAALATIQRGGPPS